MNYKSHAKVVGRKRIHFTQIDSTNQEAKRLIDQKEDEEGLLITADIQTHGRGQFGRQWESLAGQNITMSVIVHPHFIRIQDQFILNIIASLAVASVVQEYAQDVSVKWPNDVYVGNKKICGILIQNFVQGNKIKSSVIGIGLNVLQKSWPPEVPSATSISLHYLGNIKLEAVLERIIQSLDNYYHRASMDIKQLKQEYERTLYRKGIISKFQSRGDQFLGKITGISILGELQLEDENGNIQHFQHGEIKLIQ